MSYRIAGIVLAIGISVFPVPSNAQPAAITCGATLGPGGTFVLQQNLTCPPNPNDFYESAVVLDGATLDLNGHTIDCVGRQFGVSLGNGSVVANGTIIGCLEGVHIGTQRNIVRGMTLAGNKYGVFIQSGDDNLVMASIATGNSRIGFYLDDSANRNTLIGNRASGNQQGFVTISAEGTVFIGNVASDNAQTGFFTEDSARLQGNRSVRNGTGFQIEGGAADTEVIGNTARRNRGVGFELQNINAKVVIRDNVARGNDGDGFHLEASFDSAGNASAVVIRQNLAISNGGHGFHVNGQSGYFTHATIEGNRAFGHVGPSFDLADDYQGCVEGTVWQDNVFATASQPCVH